MAKCVAIKPSMGSRTMVSMAYTAHTSFQLHSSYTCNINNPSRCVSKHKMGKISIVHGVTEKY